MISAIIPPYTYRISLTILDLSHRVLLPSRQPYRQLRLLQRCDFDIPATKNELLLQPTPHEPKARVLPLGTHITGDLSISLVLEN